MNVICGSRLRFVSRSEHGFPIYDLDTAPMFVVPCSVDRRRTTTTVCYNRTGWMLRLPWVLRPLGIVQDSLSDNTVAHVNDDCGGGPPVMLVYPLVPDGGIGKLMARSAEHRKAPLENPLLTITSVFVICHCIDAAQSITTDRLVIQNGICKYVPFVASRAAAGSDEKRSEGEGEGDGKGETGSFWRFLLHPLQRIACIVGWIASGVAPFSNVPVAKLPRWIEEGELPFTWSRKVRAESWAMDLVDKMYAASFLPQRHHSDHHHLHHCADDDEEEEDNDLDHDHDCDSLHAYSDEFLLQEWMQKLSGETSISADAFAVLLHEFPHCGNLVATACELATNSKDTNTWRSGALDAEVGSSCIAQVLSAQSVDRCDASAVLCGLDLAQTMGWTSVVLAKASIRFLGVFVSQPDVDAAAVSATILCIHRHREHFGSLEISRISPEIAHIIEKTLCLFADSAEVLSRVCLFMYEVCTKSSGALHHVSSRPKLVDSLIRSLLVHQLDDSCLRVSTGGLWVLGHALSREACADLFRVVLSLPPHVFSSAPSCKNVAGMLHSISERFPELVIDASDSDAIRIQDLVVHAFGVCSRDEGRGGHIITWMESLTRFSPRFRVFCRSHSFTSDVCDWVSRVARTNDVLIVNCVCMLQNLYCSQTELRPPFFVLSSVCQWTLSNTASSPAERASIFGAVLQFLDRCTEQDQEEAFHQFLIDAGTLTVVKELGRLHDADLTLACAISVSSILFKLTAHGSKFRAQVLDLGGMLTLLRNLLISHWKSPTAMYYCSLCLLRYSSASNHLATALFLAPFIRDAVKFCKQNECDVLVPKIRAVCLDLLLEFLKEREKGLKMDFQQLAFFAPETVEMVMSLGWFDEFMEDEQTKDDLLEFGSSQLKNAAKKEIISFMCRTTRKDS
eukprot:ANDGO_07328.mRNA.1 hypothetical protein